MKSQEKIAEWTQMYLKHIQEITIEKHVSDEEGYKLKAVQHFQLNFNIEDIDLAGNLERAILNNNLVIGAQYFPRNMLVLYAQMFPEETRNILRKLFDNTQDASERITEATKAFEKLNERRNKQVSNPAVNTYIGLRFLSLLLGFRFPDSYNALKPVEWKVFARFLNPEFSVPWHTSPGDQYEIYSEYIEPLREYLKTRSDIKEIKDKLVEGLEFRDKEYRWMTQDVIYVTAKVLAKKRASETEEPNLEPNPVSRENLETEVEENGTGFMPLEVHLEEYIVKNWTNIDFGEPLTLFKDDDGTPGQQYTTDVGIIDLLAKDAHGDFVVIELKRAEEGYKVVGQVLNYMGWVQENLANKGQKVRGLVIVGKAEKTLMMALKPVSDKITLREYRMKIKLIESKLSRKKGLSELDLEAFINRNQWIYAKTMPDNPHEYVNRKKLPEKEQKEFDEIVMFIRTNGYKEKFGKTTYTCYNLDGHKYWTMGDPLPETYILNRAKI